MRLLMALALLLSGPAGASRLLAERHYHEALGAYKRQDYKAAMTGFMDAILEDPTYPGAKERMRRSASKLLALEREKADRERESLMFEIRKLQPERLAEIKAREEDTAASQAAFKTSLRTWQEALEQAMSLAKSAAQLGSALQAYSAHLESFPVSYLMAPRFAAARAEFQAELLKTFGHFGSDPLWKGKSPGEVNTGDMGRLLLTEKYHTDRWGRARDLYRPLPSEEEAAIRDSMELLRDLERGKEHVLWLSARAFRLYKEGSHAESKRGWETVLKASPGNSEAKFYLEEIAAKTAAALPAPAPAASRGRSSRAAARPVKGDAAKAGVRGDATRARAGDTTSVVSPMTPSKVVSPGEEDDLAAVPPPSTMVPSQERARELYDKGLRAYSTGQLNEAITLWRGTLELDPRHPKAKKALERALREKP